MKGPIKTLQNVQTISPKQTTWINLIRASAPRRSVGCVCGRAQSWWSWDFTDILCEAFSSNYFKGIIEKRSEQIVAFKCLRAVSIQTPFTNRESLLDIILLCSSQKRCFCVNWMECWGFLYVTVIRASQKSPVKPKYCVLVLITTNKHTINVCSRD